MNGCTPKIFNALAGCSTMCSICFGDCIRLLKSPSFTFVPARCRTRKMDSSGLHSSLGSALKRVKALKQDFLFKRDQFGQQQLPHLLIGAIASFLQPGEVARATTACSNWRLSELQDKKVFRA